MVNRRVIHTKLFLKHFNKRILNNPALLNKFRDRERLFLEDRSNPVLKDHALTGRLKNHRAFSITGDVRVVYIEIEKEIIFLFVDIGTHNQVYK